MKAKATVFFVMAAVVGVTPPAWPQRILWGPDPVPLPSSASSLWVADLDRDGRLDVAAALEEAGKVAVILSREGILDGPLAEYAVGLGPIDVKGADMDSSGAEDLVVVNSGSASVDIFLNSGGGTFAPGTQVPTDPEPRAVAIADFDGDRAPDIALVCHRPDVTVLFNTGRGAFHDGKKLRVGEDPHSVVAGDFDGNALPDLAVGFGEDRDGTWWGAGSFFRCLGGGEFAPAVKTATGSGDASIPRFMARGDFNRDGREDLAFASQAQATGQLDLFTCELDEAGAFHVRLAGSVPGVPAWRGHYLAAQDIDGDTFLDIATPLQTLGDAGLRIYRNIGGGQLRNSRGLLPRDEGAGHGVCGSRWG